MIHATDGSAPQHLRSMQRRTLRRTKNVVYTPVADRSLARIAPQIAKIFQKIAVRFAIMLHVVSEKICLVLDADLEIEIAGNKGSLALNATAGPVDNVGDQSSATR